MDQVPEFHEPGTRESHPKLRKNSLSEIGCSGTNFPVGQLPNRRRQEEIVSWQTSQSGRCRMMSAKS